MSLSLSARCHPHAQRRDLIHGEISPAEPAAPGALLAHVVQPFGLEGVLVDGEVGDGGGQLEHNVAPGAVLLVAEELGAAADVTGQVLHRSIGEQAGQDVFDRLEVVGREVLVEEEEEDAVDLESAVFVGAPHVREIEICLKRGSDTVRGL